MRYMPAMILASGLAVLSASPGLAQDAGTVQPPPPPDCTLAPMETPPGADAGALGAGQDGAPLSDVLDPCNGVLAPAPVGDQDMTIDPPDAGRTPVIEPGDVPQQPADGG